MAVWAFCILYGVHRVGLNFLLWQSEKNLEYRWEKVKKKVHKGNISNKYRWDKYVQKTVAYNEIFYALKTKMCSYQLFAKILPAVKKKQICTKVCDSVQKTCMLVKQGQNGWQPQAPILGEQMEDSGWLCVKENHVDDHVSHVGSFILDPLNIDCVPDVNTELESSKWRTQLILLKNKTVFDIIDGTIWFIKAPLNIWSLNYSSFSAMPPKLPQLKATSNARSERA